MFYEDAIWNNAEFDRPLRLATGAFLANPLACFSGVGQGVPFPVPGMQPTLAFLGGSAGAASDICSTPIGSTVDAGGGTCAGLTSAVCVANFQTTYQMATAMVGANAPNPNYIPNLISSASPIGLGALAPSTEHHIQSR